MDPTQEQQAAIDLFGGGDSIAIEAGAGTGKTSTLELIARSTQRPGTYVAFNRAIVNEAATRMPMNVTSTTAHSLAMRQVGRSFRHRLQAPRMKAWELAKVLRIDTRIVVSIGDRKKVLQPSFLAGHVMRAVRNFCNSGDETPAVEHFPYVHAIDPRDDQGRPTYANNDALAHELVDRLAYAWTDLCDPNGELPYVHDHYLKLWERSSPSIPGEFIMFDEAQDASPVMLSAVQQQTDAQVVWVGDSQQQIYEWRGAVNALGHVDAQHRTFLTQSFRFGPAIADAANVVLEELDAALRLVGYDKIASRVDAIGGTPDAVLCRSNTVAIQQVLDYQQQGVVPHLVGGAQDVISFARAAQDLKDAKDGARSWHPDLACFDTWSEVKEYVQNDPLGDDLRLMVNLIEDYGYQIIADALEGQGPEDDADVVISTAHKAKGRQWPMVRLAADFPDPDVRDLADADLRLLYVAATRAQEVLDITACKPMVEMMAGGDVRGRKGEIPTTTGAAG